MYCIYHIYMYIYYYISRLLQYNSLCQSTELRHRYSPRIRHGKAFLGITLHPESLQTIFDSEEDYCLQFITLQ